MKNYKTNLSTNTKTTASRVMINGGITSHTLDISSNGHFLFSNGGFRGACFTLSRSELNCSFAVLDLALPRPPCQRIIISSCLRRHVGVGGREQAAWWVLFGINVLCAAQGEAREARVSYSRWTLALDFSCSTSVRTCHQRHVTHQIQGRFISHVSCMPRNVLFFFTFQYLYSVHGIHVLACKVAVLTYVDTTSIQSGGLVCCIQLDTRHSM